MPPVKLGKLQIVRGQFVIVGVLLSIGLSVLPGACQTPATRTQRIEIPEIRRPPPASGRSTLLLPHSEDFCRKGLIEETSSEGAKDATARERKGLDEQPVPAREESDGFHELEP